MHDEEILILLARRDQQAVQEAQKKYGAYCMKVAGRFLASHEDCEECVNDALMGFWHTDAARLQGRLKQFLSASVRNAALDLCRRSTAQKRCGAETAVVLDELAECVSAPGTPEETIMVEELGTAIDRFLAAQSRRDRSVFLCRYYFAETTSEIAARYSLRESNVLVILSRMRKKLKKFLKQEGYLI